MTTATAEALDQVEEHTQEWIDHFVARVLAFMELLVGHELFDYQREVAGRIVESVVLNDGATITFLCSRQAGKTESVADTVAALMILLPRLAKVFPDTLGKFKDGLWVGAFAPTEDQAETLFERVKDRLTSERAKEILADPEIDDKADAKADRVTLVACGSFIRMQTANPKASIESKSYHVLVGDESQEIDEFVWNKSISPMGAFYNATSVMTGTPTTHKGVFYKTIAQNKRQQTKRGARKTHFEFDWRACARNNANYGKFIRKEMLRIGEDSDEFQMSYCLRWLLERGMFASAALLDELGDRSMEAIKQWRKTPVVVGIDPAKKQDSTVVTVVWVGWDRPDEFGLYEHRVLNWLELQGEWEDQYFKIVDFLRPYRVFAVGVDSQGVGDAVAERLRHLMPETQVEDVPSDASTQSKRWKHLMQLLERRMIGWPAHAHTRRTRTYRRFRQQMEDLEKIYRGQYLLAEAPNEADAHDDYPDSLAIACMMSQSYTMPEVNTAPSPFYEDRRRRVAHR